MTFYNSIKLSWNSQFQALNKYKELTNLFKFYLFSLILVIGANTMGQIYFLISKETYRIDAF